MKGPRPIPSASRASVLTCRPALPLSRQTLPLVSWTIGRQRKGIDSRHDRAFRELPRI